MRKWMKYTSIITFVSAATLAGASTLPAYAGTIHSGGGNVNLRAGPGTNYAIVGSLPQGATVNVECVGTGTSVSGPYGTTNMWDEIGNREWVTDAFVDTGTNNPVAMPCGYIQGEGYSFGSGAIDTNVLSGCEFTDGGGGSNHGSTLVGTDWWKLNLGCLNGYAYTYGNGSSPSGQDYARWAYYPGAFATCDIYVHIPYYDGPKPFTNIASYRVYTGNNASKYLGSTGIDQATHMGQDVYIGAWQPDGSGYLRLQLDDSSGSGGTSQVVVATQVEFDCSSEY
jgi:hypothetical protein